MEKLNVFDLLEYHNPRINLAYGFPFFEVSSDLADQACAAIHGGANNYSPPKGNPFLRRSLQHAESLAAAAVLQPPIICAGAGAGIASALFALFNDGGDLIVVDPYFVQHEALAGLARARITYVPAPPPFRLPVDDIIASLSSSTKAILLCTPNNPTGVVYSDEELTTLSRVATKNGTYVIVDEIYRDFVYSASFNVAPSLLGVCENAIIVRGFSKSLGVAGWRIGYVFANDDLLSRIAYYHKILYTCAPTPFQVALREAGWSVDRSTVEAMAANMRFVYNALHRHYEISRPEGGYFMFPRAPHGMTGTDIFLQGIERGLGLMPGNFFSKEDTHFRLTYAASLEVLDEACEILLDIADRPTSNCELARLRVLA